MKLNQTIKIVGPTCERCPKILYSGPNNNLHCATTNSVVGFWPKQGDFSFQVIPSDCPLPDVANVASKKVP